MVHLLLSGAVFFVWTNREEQWKKKLGGHHIIHREVQYTP